MNGCRDVFSEVIGGIFTGAIYAAGLSFIEENPDFPAYVLQLYTLFGIALSAIFTLATVEHLQFVGITYLMGWIGGGLLLNGMLSTPTDWLIYFAIPVLLLGFKVWKMVTARAW